MDLYAIMVIYNRSVMDSCSYQSIQKRNDIHLIVCDNSTSDYHNENQVILDGFTYINMHGNKGLSKAYNAALDTISIKDGYVLLMDDDTSFDEEYFECLKKNLGLADILYPLVKSNDVLISPCQMTNGIAHGVQSINKVDKNSISLINSGMCIRLSLFENYRYDENLFLDYVDHKFINDHRNCSMKCLDYTIHQSFSAQLNSKESARIRFQIFKKDSKYFYLTHLKNKKAYSIVMNKRKLRLLAQYKDLSFFREDE